MSTPVISSPSPSKATFKKNAPVKFCIPQSKPADASLFKANPFLRSSPVKASKSSSKVGALEKGMTTTTTSNSVASKNSPISSVYLAPTYTHNNALKLFYVPNGIQPSSEPDFTEDAKPIELPSALELPSFKRRTLSRKTPSHPTELPSEAASTAASRHQTEKQVAEKSLAAKRKNVPRQDKGATDGTKKQGKKRSRVAEEEEGSDDKEPKETATTSGH